MEETVTNTTVETENKETEKIEARQLKSVHKALFVLFAEFLGYASPLIDWAEDICDCKKDIPQFKRQLVNMDAEYIFAKMQEDYTVDEIRKWYDEFYPVILKDYDDKLKDDLPF